MRWLEVLLGLIVLVVLLTHFAIPLAIRLFSSFRLTASEVSPWRIRDLEWRNKSHAASPIPSWRVEAVSWSLGGPEAPGKLTLNVEGVTIRLRKKSQHASNGNSDGAQQLKKKKRNLPSWLKSVINYFLHLLVHHWVTAAGFLSVHITDVRVILEELDGLEVRLGDARLHFGPDASVSTYHKPPLEPDEYSARPTAPSTPADADGSDAFATPPKRPPRHSASPSISKMSKAVWSHAIGNAIGRVAFSLRVQDVALLLPHISPSATSTPASASTTSTNSPPCSAKSISTFNSIIGRPKVCPALRPSESGYDKVVALESASDVLLSIGIGPATQVFDKDNLRIDVNLGPLQLGLDGAEKLHAVNKARKQDRPPTTKPPTRIWAEGSIARRAVRALEHVTLSCQSASVYHVLPSVPPDSRSAASSDATMVDSIGHTLSLDFSALSARIAATHSGKDPRLGKIFGTSKNPSSRVPGITATLSWSALELHCTAPGKTSSERIQLASVHQADFHLLSTWRPDGWEHRDLLFSDDPALSIVIARGCVASVDVTGELQLVSELVRSWREMHPAERTSSKKASLRKVAKHLPKPPRVRVFFDIGHMSMTMANSDSEDSATMTLSTKGVTLGGTSNYDDRAGALRNGASDTSSPQTSTESLDSSSDDRPTFGMNGDAFASVDPISLSLSLGKNTYKLAKIGRIQTKIISHILGCQRTLPTGFDEYRLLKHTLATDAEVIVDDGIKVDIWRPEVVKALIQLGSLRSSAATPAPPKPRRDPLDVLPGGLSLRVAVGPISVFLGHLDLNPGSDQALVRGTWFQTTVVFDYARFPTMQAPNSYRHLSMLKMRDRLRLFKDVTASAFDHTQKLEQRGAQAALFSLLLRDTAVKTVFNGDVFVEKGGTDREMPSAQPEDPPPEPVDPEFIAWGWHGSRRREKAPGKIHLSHLPKTYLSPSALLRVPHVHFTAKVHQPVAEEASQIQLYGRVELIYIAHDISDLYCTLLAVYTVQTIARAFKRPKVLEENVVAPQNGSISTEAGEPTPHLPQPPIPISIGLAVHRIWVRSYFPLKEQAFFSLENVGVEWGTGKNAIAKSDHVLLHVLSDTQPGFWNELGRIRRLGLSIDASRAVSVNAAAFRIRIPWAFKLSQLIFNINVMLKTTRLILHNLRTGHFSLVKKPLSEPPKKLPPIRIQVDLLHFEARDHAVENRINLANRVGLLEQKSRLDLDDTFEHKIALLAEENDGRDHSNLTTTQSVSNEEARYRLDWHFSRNWVRRIRRAKAEQRRREEATNKRMFISVPELPIPVIGLEQTVPLFRFAFVGVDVTLAPPHKTRSELIKFMGDVSSEFKDDVQFSLMVPFHLTWTMTEAKVTLRDYPLPLLRVQPGPRGTPGWHVTTLFIIAEELSNDDSTMFFPIEITPESCGHDLAKALTVQIGKSLMPVKTYARPMIKVLSPDATRLTWCNSYKAGLSDFARIFDSLSKPPLDPSPKPGFWDKLRLAFHWRLILNFTGPVRWYLKGSQDPYSISGFGAGFALVWRRNVTIEIGQPNSQRELVQVMSDELLLSIPDLNVLQDQAAVGVPDQPEDEEEADRNLIERRSTKPCARFLNGVRFGLGFVFERTCRWWTCNKCGKTENLLHRQCRIFDFRPHNTVVLRTPQVVERLKLEAGHPIDSYERFRSDYIHFSVSLVAPREPSGVSPEGKGADAETHSSIHMSPKAFAHFFNWWRLFRGSLPSPIRQGPAFPDSPVASKKFGKSLATIKYRCDIAPIYLSHLYSVYSEELWTKGLGQSLGLKIRAGRFRMDGHQRAQEQRQYSEALQKLKIITHKPFYACDLLLDEITLKGMVADFSEAHIISNKKEDERDDTHPLASDLPPEGKVWYNFFDFIDADFKPFDRNPRMQIVHMGDCPHVFLSRRVKALRTKPYDERQNLPPGKEASKFGHEKTHVCYLGAALGVGPMQSQIAQERVATLQSLLENLPEEDADSQYAATIHHRINILKHHIDDLAQTETRHMDNSTLAESDDSMQPSEQDGDAMFDNTLHVHCPRLFFNNHTRNMIYKFLYCRKNRQRDQYTTSYASLRAIRDGVNKRKQRQCNGLNRDDPQENLPQDNVAELLKGIEKRAEEGRSERFVLSEEFLDEQGTLALPKEGLPADCAVHPKWRILVLKPQIALRSTADPTAIVLVALQEIAVKNYSIVDTQALDSAISEVLQRSYIAARGLQGFYPTEETMARSFKTSPDYRELDFVPLEIFLDVKSEATDYDRIILRADMGVSVDEFNHLRAPRGLEWPEATNEYGDRIDHLRLHQNKVTITMPTLTMSAKSKHWTALYYVITDLMIYTLPEKHQRKLKVDGFLLKFDRRDRDPQQLLWSLFIIQQHVRRLAELQRGYQNNFDRLTADGRRELFSIHADLLHEYEALNTVFDVINLNRSYEDAKAALQTKSRIDVRAGTIAWHMLREQGDPLLKLDIRHTLFAMDHNADGSKDLAVAISDLQALNGNPEALFNEVLTKSKKEVSRRGHHSSCFMSASISTLPQVGGISIVRELAFYIYPVRFRLEQSVGNAVVDYLFNDKTKQHIQQGSGPSSSGGLPKSSDSLSLPRTQSQLSVATTQSGTRSSRAHLAEQTRATVDTTTDFDVDAEEMRRRAAENRTYMNIAFGATHFVLDYKRGASKKHGLIPDVADFKLVAPELNYRNKVWSAKDILEEVKRDMIKTLWSQRGDLVSQMMMKTSMFRSKKSLRQIAGLNTEVEKHKHGSPKSPLRFSVQPATPLDMDDEDSPTSASTSYPASVTSTLATRSSPEETTSRRGSGRRVSAGIVDAGDADDEGEVHKHNRHGLFGRADAEEEGDSHKHKRHGLFGKLRRHSKGEDDITFKPRSRLSSLSEGGSSVRTSPSQHSQARMASTDYGGGASLRSSRSAQSGHSSHSGPRLSPTVMRRRASHDSLSSAS